MQFNGILFVHVHYFAILFRNILQKVILIAHKLLLNSSEDLLRFGLGMNKKCRFDAEYNIYLHVYQLQEPLCDRINKI